MNKHTPFKTSSTSSSNGETSLLAQFDDIVFISRQLFKSGAEAEDALIELTEHCSFLYKDYFQTLDECKQLRSELDNKIHECSDLEHKLAQAGKLLDLEKRNVRVAIKERDDLVYQVHNLLNDKETACHLPDELHRKLSSLSDVQLPNDKPCPDSAKGINSTGSLLSDFSYSRSEDDFDNSSLQTGKVWKKHRPSTSGIAEHVTKKRQSPGSKVIEIKSADSVRATTTFSVSRNGAVTATSLIETQPISSDIQHLPEVNDESRPVTPAENLESESRDHKSPYKYKKNLNIKQHSFQQKTNLTPTSCGFCGKRIGFGKTAMKCKECKTTCHVECKLNLPLPCIPSMNTPSLRNGLGLIGDYTPTTPPMVPALLIHCINEIELKGLSEIGLYRIPGTEREVKTLKEKFLKGKGVPCLGQYDIHAICGTVKDFLRNLREPILTYGLRKRFVQVINSENTAEIVEGLYQTISELPQPNRDTLAYMILHLQKVSQSEECKMNISNLAKCFGPTIVGFSSANPNPDNLINEVTEHIKIMEYLLNISSDYWSSFVNIETVQQPFRLQQTPSTDSLLHPARIKEMFQTPDRHLSLINRKQKYFHSPN